MRRIIIILIENNPSPVLFNRKRTVNGFAQFLKLNALKYQSAVVFEGFQDDVCHDV